VEPEVELGIVAGVITAEEAHLPGLVVTLPREEARSRTREFVQPGRRDDDSSEHPAVITPSIGRVVADSGLHVEPGRREEPRIIDEPGQERAQGTGNRHASPRCGNSRIYCVAD